MEKELKKAMSFTDNNKVIYKSRNTEILYIIMEVAFIALLCMGIRKILTEIENDTMYYIREYGFSRGKDLYQGIIYSIISITLTILNLKPMDNVRKNIIYIGTDYIEASNEKESLIAHYNKEIIIAAKSMFTVTIICENKQIDIPHLFSVKNIVKTAERAIDEKRKHS